MGNDFQAEVPVSVIMAGGQGSRMGGIVKPVLKVCGEPMIRRVVRVALHIAKKVVVAASPKTVKRLWMFCSAPCIDACVSLSGSSYAEDLSIVARMASRRPLLILPSDTPFLSVDLIRRFVEEATRIKHGIVTLEIKPQGPLGVSLLLDEFRPWNTIVVEWSYHWLNINTWRDYEEAQEICNKIQG